MRYLPILCCLLLLSCENNEVFSPDTLALANKAEAISLTGKSLYPIIDSETSKNTKDSLLKIAVQNLAKDSNNLENIIWLGRRLAYLSRYNEAIEVYSKGLNKFPKSPELYRHRGHRYISLRKFDEAIADFEKAAFYVKNREIEIEPDGIPNKLNIPLSSLQFNIWYHWALAYYLKGDFVRAAPLYEKCLEYSTHPDLLCATSDWLYMTYRRLVQIKKANAVLENIDENMDIVENTAYFNRLMLYKGKRKVEDLIDFENNDPEANLDIVTQGYGVGNLYLYGKDTVSAKYIFNKVLESDNWSAFGYIAAEADLHRLPPN